MQIELRDFKFSKVEVNEIYEDTMTDIEQDTLYTYGADGWIIYRTDDGIVLSFNWMTQSNWVKKGEPFTYFTQIHCHDPDVRMTYRGDPIMVINDDGEESEINNDLIGFIEATICFEREIEKDLPTRACGDE